MTTTGLETYVGKQVMLYAVEGVRQGNVFNESFTLQSCDVSGVVVTNNEGAYFTPWQAIAYIELSKTSSSERTAKIA